MAIRAGDVGRHKPAAIVWPRSTEEVAQIVRWARDTGTPLVPFGAGSGVCGGVLPEPRAVVVDLKKMARWRRLDPTAPLLEVEAGHMGVPLEDGLGRHGLTLGHFPSSILCSTVGGWVAGRSAGQMSGLYGKIEDMIVDLECVTGTGDVVRLCSRSGSEVGGASGPSLVPFVVGSEGTLAIVTSATLRLHRAPTSRGFASYSFPTMRDGWEAIRALFQAGLRPAAARLYDPFDAMLARKGSVGRSGATRPAAPRAGGVPGLGAAALRALVRRPSALNALLESSVTGRAFGGALLVLVFEGTGQGPADDVAEAGAMLRGRGGRDAGEAPARAWLEHRYAISYRQAPALARGLFVDTMEVAARWSHLQALYDGVRHALGPRVFVMAHMSHAYPDGCCIYFSFAGGAGRRAARGEWDAQCERAYDGAWRAALAAALDAGATLAHHHGVGRSKAPMLGRELGLGVEVFGALKRAFDPDGILNPGALDPRPNAGAGR